MLALLAIALQEPTADDHFRLGHFEEAKTEYQRMINDKIDVPHSFAQLGFIYELENDIPKALPLLKKAYQLDPNNDRIKLTLAMAYYRNNDFNPAAPYVAKLSKAGHETRKMGYAMIGEKKLANWRGKPYQLTGPNQTSVPMIIVNPLPVIALTINGKKLQMFIDTGGAEIAIDSDVADKLKIPAYSTEVGTFSGGKTAKSSLNRIDRMTIGGWTLKNVPGCALPLAALSKMFGTRIDGCVGSTFLMQYLSTLDFPNKKLILRKKTAANLAAFEQAAPNKAVLKMWLAGDHFALTHATINTAPECVLFVDTGFAGGYAKLGDKMIAEAGITIDKSKGETSTGAAGSYTSIPFEMDSFQVGPITIKNANGNYEGPFPWQESYGFFLAGMYGHTFFLPYATTLDYSGMRIFLR